MAMPTRPQRHTLRLVLIIVGVVVVFCGLAGTAAFFVFRSVSQSAEPARRAADRFITDLETGDTSAAYGLLCERARDDFSPAEFAGGVNQQSRIRRHAIVGVRVRGDNGDVSATVTAKLIRTSGFVDVHTFPLVQEDGTWRVCGQPY